jgi:hypothetical protein
MQTSTKVVVAGGVGVGLWWLFFTCGGRELMNRALRAIGRPEQLKPCCPGCADHAPAPVAPAPSLSSSPGFAVSPPAYISPASAAAPVPSLSTVGGAGCDGCGGAPVPVVAPDAPVYAEAKGSYLVADTSSSYVPASFATRVLSRDPYAVPVPTTSVGATKPTTADKESSLLTTDLIALGDSARIMIGAPSFL